jgi:hypothetical protein
MLSSIVIATMAAGIPKVGFEDSGPPGVPQEGTRTLERKWNLASEFCLNPNQANPNPDNLGHDTSYFMESSTLARNPATYVLLTEFITNALLFTGIQQWKDPMNCFVASTNCLPAVGINATDGYKQVVGIQWPQGTVRLHPTNSQLAIVGWRSPFDGRVAVRGTFIDMDDTCGDGVNWFADQGAVSLASGSIPDGGSHVFSLLDVTVA